MLTDDSAVEQCAVRKAFPGLSAGEQEVTHLLCRVHSQRTLLTKLPGLGNQKTREHLLAALYNRKTKPGCEESITAALDAAPANKHSYVLKEWWNTRADWANYNRCHSSLLLQVSSTNVVESWHAALKNGVKAAMTNWSLFGIVYHLANTADQWDKKAAKVAADFRTKHLSDAVDIPGLESFHIQYRSSLYQS